MGWALTKDFGGLLNVSQLTGGQVGVPKEKILERRRMACSLDPALPEFPSLGECQQMASRADAAFYWSRIRIPSRDLYPSVPAFFFFFFFLLTLATQICSLLMFLMEAFLRPFRFPHQGYLFTVGPAYNKYRDSSIMREAVFAERFVP